MRQEFKRYFDTGVFHSKESWILEAFGQAESEGLKFVVDELKYFLLHKPSIIPQVIIRDGFKFIGYQLGAHEKLLPAFLKTKFGMVPRNRRKY
uniref:CAZy families GT2 protein n=1 Tax=uncultured Tolumonas sp. TaxID=263765 RepID=A0A060C4U0_9GAMM|nr:CAZy families GT2 protein [uncultured Tolumonas sp.]